MKNNERLMLRLLAAVIVLAHASEGAAQSPAIKYPTQTIHIVAATSPGGGIDFLARIIGQKLTEGFGAPHVVDNKPGGNGVIGNDFVAKAAPDGYTLLMGSSSIATNKFLHARLPFDVETDFVPVVFVGYIPLILVAHPSFPPNSVRELIAFARSRPGEVHFATGGTGAGAHLSGELLKHLTRVDLLGIPYKGNAPALNALLGGHVSIMFDTITTSLPHVKGGRLKALAVTSSKRATLAPEYPTMIEAGVPDFEISAWYMVYAPKKTPREIVQKLNAQINRSFADPELGKRMLTQGVSLAGGTPEQAAAYLQSELKRWRAIIRAAGIKGDS